MRGAAQPFGRARPEIGIETAVGPWLAIWQGGELLSGSGLSMGARPCAEMTLCLEFIVPRMPGDGPLRLWQGRAGPDHSVALYLLEEGAFRLVHGGIDLTTAPDLGRYGETMSLRYRTCARGRGDGVELVNHDRGSRYKARAGWALSARPEELLPRDPRFLTVCHVAAIAGFGLPSSDLPGLSGAAMVRSVEGPCRVDALRVGQELVTLTGGVMPLRWIERRPRLCLGRAAPVRLRAPYFKLAQDIWVTPDTRVLRSGPAVEYMLGTEQVLVRAGDMTMLAGAQRDRSLAVRNIYHLMLDDHACVMVDRCGIETALLADVVASDDARRTCHLVEQDKTPCLPVLDRAGAQALVGFRGRGSRG
jgi:hypothetical protein